MEVATIIKDIPLEEGVYHVYIKFTLFLILNTASKAVYHFNLNLIDLLQPVIMIFFWLTFLIFSLFLLLIFSVLEIDF